MDIDNEIDDVDSNIETIEVDGIVESDDDDSDGTEDVNSLIEKESFVPPQGYFKLKYPLLKHTESIYSVDIDPVRCEMAATGSGDDTCILWDLKTGNPTQQFGLFKDSVTEVCFSYDSKYLAMGDMSGVIKVVAISSLDVVWSTEVDDLTWLEWHKKTNALIAGTSTGVCYLWKIPSGKCKILSPEGCQISVGKILPDGKRAVFGYKNGTVKVVSLEIEKVECTFKKGIEEILSLDVCNDNNLIAYGDYNGQAVIVSSSNNKVLQTWQHKEDTEHASSVEDVAFCPNLDITFIATASITTLHIFDYVKMNIRGTRKESRGICKIKWDKLNPTYLIVSTLEAEIWYVDSRNLDIIKAFEFPASSVAGILTITVSSNGNQVLAGDYEGRGLYYSIEDRNLLN